MTINNETQDVKVTSISKERLPIGAYLVLCISHFSRHWWKYAFPVAVLWVAQIWVRIDINYTDSLPHHVYLTLKGYKDVGRGDYVAFRFSTEHPASPFRQGAHFLKMVVGVEGDNVQVDTQGHVRIVRKGDDIGNSDIFGGGLQVGQAKSVSKTGRPLEPFKGGVIAPGHIYVAGTHPDSLDSRYEMVGLVSIADDVIGKSYPLF